MVATLSELPAGVPQAEQKRPVAGKSIPHVEHGGMNFTATVYLVSASLVRRRMYYHPNDELAPTCLVG